METAQDAMEEFKIPLSTISPKSDDAGNEPQDDPPLLTALGFDIVSLDALQARTGLPTPEQQAKLLELELDSQITRLPGGLFQRLKVG